MGDTKELREVPGTQFIEEFGAELKAKCLQDEPPFCEVACPFHLPICDMEEKWEKGRFNAVYRTYQTSVLFPAIVSEICTHPCEACCIRHTRGGSVALGELEKATVRLARRTKPNAYNLPQKPQRIAIVGAGLCGLGCALRLCNKKYQVTLFEKTQILGGNGRRLMDPEKFDEEIRNQFCEEHPDLRMGQEARDLNGLKEEYDAVFVAVGAGENLFDLTANGQGAFASTIPGVFFGGEMAGAPDPVYALAAGIRASLAVERYLKTKLMNEPLDEVDTRLIIDASRIEIRDRVVPQDPMNGYTGEEVAEEAKRCCKCSCDICQKECDLMRIQEKTPGRLYEEAYITVRPSTLANDGRWATRRIASCDQCGLCRNVCPQRIDMGNFLMQSHRGLKDTDAMPWAFHDFWLRDMEFSIGTAAAVIRRPDVLQSEYAFFPGCQFGASAPELLEKICGWLLEKKPDSAIWLNCCGAPAVWAAEDEWQMEHAAHLHETWVLLGCPTLILACPSCRKMLDRFLPDIPCVFLEEVLALWGLPDMQRDTRTNSYAVFDPCASRDYPQLQTAVRALCEGMDLRWEELSHTGKNVRCCSYGGQYAIAAPDYAKRVRMERALESELPYITYCMNCRDTFASRRKENIHILELVFGGSRLDRPVSTFTMRRENRVKLKAQLSLSIAGIRTEERSNMIQLICSEELGQKLSDHYILISDMEEVVAWCEERQIGVCREDGSVVCHKKIGHMTYWAEYRMIEPDVYELINGYSHRMNLEGE